MRATMNTMNDPIDIDKINVRFLEPGDLIQRDGQIVAIENVTYIYDSYLIETINDFDEVDEFVADENDYFTLYMFD